MNVQGREQRFPREDIGDIIDLAARLDDLVDDPTDLGLTFDQLIRVAGEVGISREAVERAVRDQRKQKTVDEREAKKRVRRRMRFIRHLLAYLVVVSALLLVDALNGGGWWFFYVAALWGAVLAIQGLRFVTRRKGPLEQAMIDRETDPDQPRS